jgi:hypothetical protein
MLNATTAARGRARSLPSRALERRAARVPAGPGAS